MRDDYCQSWAKYCQVFSRSVWF